MSDSGDNRVFTQSYDSFEEAFPEIEEIEVDVEETDLVETQRTLHYTIENIRGKVPCTNSQCTNRGVRLDSLISEMKREGDSHGEFTKSCEGVEKFGQNDHRTCPHNFHVEIDLEFRD